jgi:hypothetical protein
MERETQWWMKKTQHGMKGDTVVDGRTHNRGCKEIQWWMEEDTAQDERLDTVVDGRRHKTGWKGRYR